MKLTFSTLALAGCFALAGSRQAQAQEPPSQDKLNEGAVGHKSPLPEQTGPGPGEGKPGEGRGGRGGGGPKGDTPAKDPCAGPGGTRTIEAAPDILKPAPADGEAVAAPAMGGGGGGFGGGAGGGGGRRGRPAAGGAPAAAPSDKIAFDFELVGADGKGVPYCTFKGKTVMIVNLARNSAYATQLAGIEKLQEQYKDKGLLVLGVPSNEFGAAEPGTDAEIQKIYTVEDKVTFPVLAKSELTGDKELPFFEWLGKAEGGPIHWNFTKIFIDKTGKPIARFDPDVAPDSLEMQAAVPEILAGKYKAPSGGGDAPAGRRGGGGGGMMGAAPPMD
jgi:glutathione peroxidase